MSDDKNIQTTASNNAGDEVLRAIHSTKSYVGPALITFVLYYVGFYLIGLIANIIFLGQASDTMKATGSSPSGRGCLLILIWVHLIIPIIFFILLFTIGFSGMLAFVPWHP